VEVAVLNVLALNCGSSSLKFGAYKVEGTDLKLIAGGDREEIGEQDYVAVLDEALQALNLKAPQFDAVGHRFVHGGRHLRDHCMLDATVAEKLSDAVPYAPLHMPAALAVLKAVRSKLPGVPQAVCLDTAFHRNMPEVSRTFALPENVRKLGVERYGFHGLSLESIVQQLGSAPARLIVAHLGNGASITAIRNGVSVDTSMGMTPTGGFLMGTRTGDLDPGVLIYLLRHGYGSAEALERLCDRESGLRGVSGGTSDVRELLERRNSDSNADLALSMFCYQVRKTVSGMAAALGGVDMLVFTGGIGEHAGGLREEIICGLAFLGKFEIRVLPSREDEQIARNTARLLLSSPQ
jgi:acetate kinase